MIVTTKQQQQLADYLRRVTDFFMARKGRHCLPTITAEKAFRYLAFCHLTGRLNVRCRPNGAVDCIVICWPDFKERIEAKHAEGMSQFEWGKVRPGDCIFLAEVVGSRSGVKALYQGLVEAFPNLLRMPVYTYRRGKLVQLTQPAIERFVS